MVKITNGKNIITVASGVYSEVYKKQGWKLYNQKEEVNPEEHVESEDNNLDISLDEKPIKEMSLEELQEYAKINEINIEGLTEKKEIRKAIREAMND